MSSIDERVVKMTFDNDRFEAGVKQSMKSLQALNKSTDDLGNASENLKAFERIGNSLSLSGLENSIVSIEKRFSTLGIAGMTAIQNITTSAMVTGKKIANSITSPIIEGGKVRAKNIEQAKFQIEGLGKKWSDVEEDINYGVKDTAYGLDVAAKAASQFMASGVKAGKEMKTALRGISGVSAMTNSSYEEISRIFTSISGANRVYGNDLLQLSSRGMNAAATLAKYLNKSEADVREMVTKGKIDFKTFAAAMDSAFGEHAKEANKTFDGALSNMKASLSRIGAEIAGPTYTDLRDIFNSLTPIFNNAKKAMMPFLDYVNKQLKNLTKSITKFLNRFGVDLDSIGKKIPKRLKKSVKATKAFMKSIENIGKGIKNIYKTAKNLLIPIKEAFREIFPKKTIKDFRKFTTNFKNFTKKIKNSLNPFTQILNEKVLSDKMQKIKRIFKGFFSIFSIGITLIKRLFSEVKNVWNSSKQLREMLFNGIVAISDFITKLNVLIKKSELVGYIFGSLRNIFNSFIGICQMVGTAIGNMFSHTNTINTGALAKFTSFINSIVKAFFNFTKGIANGFMNSIMAKPDVWADKLINGGLLAALIALRKEIAKTPSSIIKNITQPLTDLVTDFGKIPNAIADTFDSLTKAFGAFSKKVKAEAFHETAKSIAILTASLWALSLIDDKRLAASLVAMGTLFSQLSLFMRSFSRSNKRIDRAAGFTTMAASLVEVGLSILLLARALKIISDIPWKKMKVGISAISILFTIIGAFLKVFSSKDSMRVVKGIGSLILVSIAIEILSDCMLKLSKLSWDKLSKGAAAISALLLALGAFAKIVSGAKRMFSVGISMILIAAALEILVDVAKKFSEFSWEGLGKAGAALSGLMTVLVLFSRTVKGGKLITASIGLVVAGAALEILVDVAKKFSKFSWEGLERAGAALSGLMTILVLFSRTVKGGKLITASIGLVVAGAALEILVDVAKKFSEFSWEGLERAGAALSGLMTILVLFSRTVKGGKLITASIGLVVAGAALEILVDVAKKFSEFSWEGLERAGAALSGLMTILVLFSRTVNPRGFALLALGLPLVAVSFKGIADVLTRISELSWGNIIKSIAAMSALLAITKVFSKLNPKNFLGFTLSVLGLALAIKVLTSIDVIGAAVGLGVLIGLFVTLGLAAVILRPLLPIMKALSSAVIRFSGALLVFSLSVLTFGLALLTIGSALLTLASAGDALSKTMGNLAKALQEHGADLVDGIWIVFEGLLNKFRDLAPKLGEIILTYIKETFQVIIKSLPEIIKLVDALVAEFLPQLAKYIPDLVDTLLKLLINVIEVLTKKVPILVSKIGVFLSVLIGSILGELQNIDPQTFASAILAFGALAGIFVIMSKLRSSVKDALIVGLAMVAVFGTLTLVFLALNTINPDSLMKITFSLVTLLVALSGAMVLFGLLGGLAAAADAALIPIAIFIGGIGAILLALGLINKIPFVKDLIDSGGELLASIGTALGKFIGGFVGGIASGIASNLPKIATSLSKFMKNLQPFLKGLKSISRGMMDSAFMIVKLLLAFTAMSVVNSITNFFTGGNGDVCKLIIQFGESLAKLGPNISKFAASVKGISAKDVSTATFAALMLAKVANGLPKSGGFLQSILGETMSLETFGKNLVVFGNGMADFSNSVKDIKIGHVTAAASAAKMLSEIAKNLPKEGGFLEGIVGKTQSLSTFAKQLPGIGEGIKAYYDSIKNNFKDKKTGKLNKNTLEILNSSIDIAKKFAEFAVKISEIKIDEGSFKAFWEGSSTSLENFGNQIASFGKGLVKFAKYVTTGFDYKDESLYGDTVKHMAGIFSGGDKDRLNEVENGIEMAKKFVNLAKQINTIIDPSDFQKMFGDDTKTTLKNFGQQLPFLAKGMVEFSQIINGNLNKIYYGGTYTDIARSSKNGIAGLDSEAIERALAPLTALLKPVLELTKTTDSNEIEKAGDLLSKLKDLDFSALSLAFDPTKVNYENIKNAGDCLSALLNPLGDLAVYANAEQIEKLGNLLSTISGFNLENLVKAFTDKDSISKLNKAGNTIGAKITASICKILGINENDDVKTANSKKALNIGKIIIRSICHGMAKVSFDETVQKIINRLNATFDNEKYKTQLHIIGHNISKGLAKGMIDKKGIKPVKSSAKQLGEIAKKSTKKALEQKSPSKAYWRMGLNNDKGLAFGMLDNLKLISDASKKAGDTAVDSISMPMETISNLLSEDLDSNPVITPVLDLSNIQNGSGLIDNLLTPNALSFGMGVNASLNSSYDKPAKNTPKVYNDSKVVGAIGELQSDIGTLNNNISNLKVVMNTGEMVGVLSPRIDKSLGVAATYKERGI